MRSNSQTFDLYNQDPVRELRLVVKIDFPSPVYLASHGDIPNLPAGALPGVLQKVSSSSQRLIPEQGRAEIGAVSFEVVDVGAVITDTLRDQLDSGNGIKGRAVTVYQGGRGMDWADFRVEQTQVAEESLSYDVGVYRVRCRDIQREMRRDIFTLNSTKLAADFSKGASTLQVFSTDGFEPCPHYNSNGDGVGPGTSFYYLKIKYKDGYEIVRASGKTATSFTGCVRARFGTPEADHVVPVDADNDSGVDVEEYVYLEMPGSALAYALLTGDVLDREPDVLPGNWHLGIDSSLVDRDQFLSIGADWFNRGSFNKGMVLRFQGLSKTDGKRFIEQEICLLLGAYMPISAFGKIGFRRMAGVLANAGTVGTITADDVTSVGELQYDLSGVRNLFGVQWSWFEAPGIDGKFVRSNNLVDAGSIGTHGSSKPLTLKFKGLHNSRHTFTTIKNIFDALRDRYAGPPLRLRVGLLPSKNDLEVGDVVRVTLPQLRDHSQNVAGGTLDRAMEIQRISVDQVSGSVTAELFGSYQAASYLADQDATVNSSAELPDSWYSAEGTSLAAAGLSVDGSGFLSTNGTLAGSASSRTIYYYLGDLTIPTGKTLTVTNNVELRVRGVLTINGSVVGTSGNNAAGFIGSCRGGDGQLMGKYGPSRLGIAAQGEVVKGRNEVMPPLAIVNDAGDLQGLPDDMRGSGGASGGDSFYYLKNDNSFDPVGYGGAGGAGGAGLAIVARGIAFGVSGKIDTSGGDGNPGTQEVANRPYGGSGGGGAPGGVVLLVDGTQNPMPIVTGSKIVACYGDSPAGYGKTGLGGTCLGTAAARVLFVPKSRAPYADEEASDSYAALIAAAQQAAADAAQTADAAQADATASLDKLSDINSDGVLDPAEKLRLIREKAQLDAEQAGIVAQATDYGIGTEKTAYTTAASALTTYLDGLDPAWDDITQSTTIVRATADSKWEGVYDARQTLLNAIAEKAAAGIKQGGRGANLNAPAYTRYHGYTVPPFGYSLRVAMSSTAVSSSPIGSRALKIECVSVASAGLLNLTTPDNDPLFYVEAGKEYILSCWANASNSATDFRMAVIGQGSVPSNDFGGSNQSLGGGWVRYSWKLSPTASGGGILRIIIDQNTWSAGDFIRVDGVMIEEAIGNQTAPSALQQTAANYTNPVTGQPFDQRGLQQSVGALPSVTTSTALSSSDNGTTAKITIAAHTVQYDFGPKNYNAGSITGLPFNQKRHVYCDDPGYNGGAVTYQSATTLATVASSQGNRYIGTLTTASDGGGTTLPPSPDCVAAGMWLRDGLVADNCQQGDLLHCWDTGDADVHLAPITHPVRSSRELCVIITMASGAQWIGSARTPVTDRDGVVYEAQDCRGVLLGVLHDDAPLVWELVKSVAWVGEQTVYHISVDNISYAAGVDPRHRVVTHNIQYKP